MKKLILCIIVASMFGCKAPVKPVKAVKKNRNILPASVNFSWIRNAKELNLETVNIYYKGVAKGKFTGKKRWRGKITGEIFCKPLEADKLQDGLYIQNGAIKVNENSTIEMEGILFGKVISFGRKNVNFSNGKNARMSGKSITVKLGEQM